MIKKMTRKTQTLKKVKSQIRKTRKVRKHGGGPRGAMRATGYRNLTAAQSLYAAIQRR
jgi:hypothetical protein